MVQCDVGGAECKQTKNFTGKGNQDERNLVRRWNQKRKEGGGHGWVLVTRGRGSISKAAANSETYHPSNQPS